jgi:ATPase subunit of ABC transporter with duplicated ATPase domains
MITLRNITLRRGTKVVLHSAGLVLQPGEKVGLIGRNGAGKSSLFSLLTDRLHADTGDVEIPPRWRVGEVAQEMPETEDGATDFVLAGDLPLAAAQAELAAAEASGDGEAMAHAHLALEEAGAFDARARAQALLLGLGFKVDQLDAPVNSFSGGWRMRLQLARALMCPSDLLLLDEPTNHLDLTTREALSIALNEFEGTVMLVSHDRALLREVCDEFWLVARGRVEPFDGDLDDYQKWLLEVSRANAKGLEQPAPPRALAPPVDAPAAAPPPAAPAVRNDRNDRNERKASAEKRQQLANRTLPLRNELSQIDTRLETLTAEKSGIENQMASGAVPGAEMAELGRRLNHTLAEIAMLEERWLELQGEIETLTAGG